MGGGNWDAEAPNNYDALVQANTKTCLSLLKKKSTVL